jgi:hypothetical protein
MQDQPLGKQLHQQIFQHNIKNFKMYLKKNNADILPEHRPYDYAIDLQNGAQPPFGPIYNLSQNEHLALKDYTVARDQGRRFFVE